MTVSLDDINATPAILEGAVVRTITHDVPPEAAFHYRF
jgi:hypothetical protein